jgi:ribosome biogenesis GTPase
MILNDLGWNEAFAAEFVTYAAKGWQPGRLIRGNRITFGALAAGTNDLQEVEATLSGKVFHATETGADLPAVGDWVALEVDQAAKTAIIQARLTRQSCLSRRAVGDSEEEQVIAANVSTVVVVTDAGADFNLRRMERFFSLIARSGAKAVVVLNKADLFSETKNLRAARAIAKLQAAADVHVTSAKTRKGLAIVKGYLALGQTIAFIGSSGVGKSALINRLIGDDSQWTGSVNEITGKGRHTTTSRELMLLPTGGMIIDNPGIKEVQLWIDEQTLRESFTDIEKLSAQCEFDDCKHGTDAGCALRAALAKGTLSPERLKAYQDMDGEVKKLQTRRLQRKQILERRTKLKQRDKSKEWVQFGGEREDEYKSAGRQTS